MLGCFYTSLRNQPKRRKGVPPAAAWKAPPHMCFCRLGKITAHQSPVENPPPTGYTSDRQPVTPQRSFPYMLPGDQWARSEEMKERFEIVL